MHFKFPLNNNITCSCNMSELTFDLIDSRRDSWFSVKSYMPNTSPNNNLSSSPSLEHLMAISSDSETDSFYDAEGTVECIS